MFVHIYIHRHTVHCEGTSVSLDPFMLSADPNPESMSKTQVKGKECMWVSVMKGGSLSCSDFGAND